MTAVANPQALEQAAEQIAYWIEHPLDFVRDEFNVELEPFQIDAILHFNDPKCQRVAMKACKGPGKTAVLAWCAWLFMATRPHTKVAATAISGDNLADNLWTEMAKWQDRSAFLTATFEWTKTRIFARDHPKTWWMSARQWSRTANKEQQANTLAGLHADFLLFILDESGSIPDSVMAAADAGLATGVETKIIQAGNPTELAGPLYRACTLERHLWHVIEITGDPADPNRCTRVSLKWAQEQIDRYGADNPWVLVNVFGKFPPASLNVLLGPDQVNEALGKHHSEDVYNKHAKILGVDPGRFGGARSVIFPRQGLASFMPVVMRPDRSKKDWTGTLAGRIAQGFDKWAADAIIVDDTGGWGAGVIDALEVAGYPVIPVNFGAAAMDNRYKNRRAEMYFAAAEWVKAGGALPNVPEIVREATASHYWFRNGQFSIEEKEQVSVALNGESPDLWDAFCLTHAQPIAPREHGSQRAHAKTHDEDEEAVGHAAVE